MPTIDVPNIAANTPLWLALITTFVAAVSGATEPPVASSANCPEMGSRSLGR